MQWLSNEICYVWCQSSPFILNATLNKQHTQSTDQVSTDMLRNLHVDDLVYRESDDGSAVNYYQDARNTTSPVGLNLRSWSSNIPGIQLPRELQTGLKTFACPRGRGIV